MDKITYKDKDVVFTDELHKARKEAIEVIKQCRFLKSTTYVGCCLITNKNNLYKGCNFDYEWGIAVHAEDSAITNMIVNGELHETINFCYIYAERDSLTSCGSCRDKLKLFGHRGMIGEEDMLVYIDNGKEVSIYTLDEMIPFYPKR